MTVSLALISFASNKCHSTCAQCALAVYDSEITVFRLINVIEIRNLYKEVLIDHILHILIPICYYHKQN